MMQLEQHAGRLAEVRFRTPVSMDELSEFISRVRSVVEGASSPLVFCCDWREIDAFDTTFVDSLVWTMRRDNPRIAANGVLVSASNAALFEQVSTLLHEARNPNRQVFRSRRDLVAFLDPLLDPAERQRRDAFLDESRAPAESLPPADLRAAANAVAKRPETRPRRGAR